MTKCYHCGRADVKAGPMHVALLSRSFPERQREFCQWACANEHLRVTEKGLDDVEVRFLGSYGGVKIGILGHDNR